MSGLCTFSRKLEFQYLQYETSEDSTHLGRDFGHPFQPTLIRLSRSEAIKTKAEQIKFRTKLEAFEANPKAFIANARAEAKQAIKAEEAERRAGVAAEPDAKRRKKSGE
ncbi:unnamed protein product [Amoebophrya sp. A120]|nr:unnamed protein product [Amoebophrya sp. A120]|eukprot:GSA120T00011489001.1